MDRSVAATRVSSELCSGCPEGRIYTSHSPSRLLAESLIPGTKSTSQTTCWSSDADNSSCYQLLNLDKNVNTERTNTLAVAGPAVGSNTAVFFKSTKSNTYLNTDM